MGLRTVISPQAHEMGLWYSGSTGHSHCPDASSILARSTISDFPNGQVKLELRVQSTVSNDQTQLTRSFSYLQTVSSTPTLFSTPTPTITQ